MKFSLLLNALSEKEVLGADDVEISGLSYDSRQAVPGSLFIAIPGFHVDGHEYILEALKRGARGVVAERGWVEARGRRSLPGLPQTTWAVVPESRRALSSLAAAFYGYPAQKLRVIGVTGTDGKTTTCHLISEILARAGHRCGLMTSVSFQVGDSSWENETRHTTLEAPEVQQLMAKMVVEGVEYAIIESTSHALTLHRVADCEYDVGVFTNLSSEHLDFHRTQEEYMRAKGKLFTLLARSRDKGIPKVSVLNADDPCFDYLRSLAPREVVSYGLEASCQIMAREVSLSGLGTSFLAITPQGDTRVQLGLAGLFNVYNSLAAMAVGLSQGVSLSTIKEALASAQGAPGRMERVDSGQPFQVIVDYAHTPHGLEKVLGTVRSATPGRVILVFGCMGERDRTKRPAMGQIAAQMADFFILTNEDPCHEDPLAILEEIEVGVKAAGATEGQGYLKILDRRQAILEAFERARPDDLVLLTGKGHEKCMIVGEQRIPWDDRAVARELLRLFANTTAEGGLA